MSVAVSDWLLWGALALLAYSYVVYPVLVIAIARVMPRRFEHDPPPPAQYPRVAVVIAAFNEEASIGRRLENLREQDYPPDRLQVLVGCDGCTDRTAEFAALFAGPSVSVHAFTANRGKASVLNDLVALCDAEFIVFTDANTVFRTDTVRRLVTAFDEHTAAVCGELIMGQPSGATNEDHRYWNFERRLKLAESAIGGLLGANGGVYAIRRSWFRPLHPDTICDDFVIAMNIAVAQGALRYVPSAAAFEEIPADVQAEFHRRARIGTGNYQALFRNPQYLYSGSPVLTFTYFSHKVLRWFTPHLTLAVFVCTLLKAGDPAYFAFAGVQLAAMALAAIVFSTRHRVVWPGPFRFASLFAVLNAAFLVGFSSFITGNYRGSWRRTARP